MKKFPVDTPLERSWGLSGKYLVTSDGVFTDFQIEGSVAIATGVFLIKGKFGHYQSVRVAKVYRFSKFMLVNSILELIYAFICYNNNLFGLNLAISLDDGDCCADGTIRILKDKTYRQSFSVPFDSNWHKAIEQITKTIFL